jgi:histidine kinase-like protein
LLVSELATNALLHGRGNIKLRAAIDAQRVWAAVIDEGGGFDESLHRRECDQIGGWGLGLVDVLASGWGVENSSQVWFELRRPAADVERAKRPLLPSRGAIHGSRLPALCALVTVAGVDGFVGRVNRTHSHG